MVRAIAMCQKIVLNLFIQAVKWFKAAAQQNIPIAQAMLAQKYYRGQGVRQNRAEAKEWTGRACDNGIEDACHNYRLMNEGKY